MAEMTATKPPTKLWWGELDDEEDYDFLPPPLVIGPDENGVKKLIEYRIGDNGEKVRVTTTTRTRKIARARLSKRAIERRTWAKFGDAASSDAVSSSLTMISTEEILLERPREPGSKVDETKTGDLSTLSKVAGGTLMMCRTCGKKGDHWTSKCPYKDLAAQTEMFSDKLNPGSDFAASTSSGTTKPGTYVPPGMRPGADRSIMPDRRRNDENSIRVGNLSEDTQEADVLELFRTFGPVTRVYVAVDQKTGMSRGFGFVNFVAREDAEKAINKLNGYGYDNLILKVEWAAPRAN